MILRRFLPRSMVTRLALVLLAALAVEFAGISFLNKWHERGLLSEEQTRRIAEQLASADQIVTQVDTGPRPSLMADMAIRGMTLNWVPGTVITDSSAAHPQLLRMRKRLDELAPRLAGRDLRLSLIPSDASGERDLLGALRVADGSFVTFRVRPFLGSPPSFAMTMAVHLLLVGIVLGAALLMVRTLVRPLSELAEAADATGRGATPDIKIEGPWEVRRVATAFRTMQVRLLQMIEDHTQALIAVSHDLRTPIQRLRVRTALLADEEMRDAISADLIDMEKFIGSVVGFMQGGSEEEDKLVDLAGIAMTLVDNIADVGADIGYEGPDELPVRLKPLALKRALGNLVENACRHGNQVRVTLRAGDPIVLSVEDDGPGIPAAQRSEALLPFRKLGPESGRGGGSSGLGLAIARKAVASFDGDLVLGDSAMGGLAAAIEIPACRRAADENDLGLVRSESA